MSVKCLCKIAILKTNQKTNNNSVTLNHYGKIYTPIIELNSHLIADVLKHRDFCLVALKCDDADAEYLTIVHHGTRQPGRRRVSRENILSICFPDFQSIAGIDVEIETSKETQAMKIHDLTAKLFSLLRSAHIAANSRYPKNPKIKIERLQPELRNYQQKTLQWLLRRELESATLNHFYKKLTSREGSEHYVDLLTLDIIDAPPENIDIPSGGILAEEMGLGKTVEIISLILLNQRVLNSIEEVVEPVCKKPRIDRSQEVNFFCVCSSTKLNDIQQCSKCFLYQHQKCIRSFIDFPLFDEDNYICPKCWEMEGILVTSAATVIVSPISIKLQWLSEINKHTNPPLRVLLYEGVSKQKISPKELASYDIVLIDYAILRSEVHYTASNESQISFRTKPRSMRVNSPLVLVDWWRVCLDEAQMESTKSRPAKIVKQLPATHRWTVTGTPIQNSLDDLVNFLDFIGFKDAIPAWQHLSSEFNSGRSENMIKFLQKVMWRTSKSEVVNELGIPPQEELTHFVELNNVEKLFYSDDHADCLSAFYDKIQGYSDLKGVTAKVLNTILQPMLKLRQDCSIPVLILKSETNVVKKFLQPQELIDHMKSTNELECKDQLRSMASICNGMAALHFLRKNYNDAINYYERVIKLSKTYTGPISVDSLLQIHALYNAIQAYRTITLEDTPIINEYEVECNKLEWKYLEPYALNLQAAHKGYNTALSALNIKKLSQSCRVWEHVLQVFKSKGLDGQLLNKINDEVFTLHSSTHYKRFRITNTVLMVLDIWYRKIISVRNKLSFRFNSFNFFIQNVRPRNDVSVDQWRKMNEFIRTVYDCHLRKMRDHETKKTMDEGKSNKDKNLCALCETQKLLQTYECLIFDKTIDEKTSNAEGTWNPTMQETIVKSIYSAVRGKIHLKNLVEDCDLQMEIIASMKTEYKELVKLWIEIEYTVKAYDEMDMCKMRTSLVKEDEEKTHCNVYDYEIDDVLAESKLNFDDAQRVFVLKYARLKYVRHLEEDTDPGACPICHSEGQIKYVVLECGHHLCFFCLKTISQIQKTAKLTCSICRHEQKYQNVFYVTRKITNKEGIDIKGDYSSKIQKILLEVLKLKSLDKNVKIIIFSQWLPILKAINEALIENNVTCKINITPQCVEKFKSEILGITCLLMLLKKKSQGLNLVEATHVFLVEPILNSGEELQAIGRIHRIGQTKPTFVHRFVVKNTIEENIYNTVSKDKTNKSCDLTIESIKKLFELNSYNS